MILAQQMKPSRDTTHLAGKVSLLKSFKKMMLSAPFHSQLHSVTNNANNAKAQNTSFLPGSFFSPFSTYSRSLPSHHSTVPPLLRLLLLILVLAQHYGFLASINQTPSHPDLTQANMMTGMKNVFQRSCVVS